MPTYLPVGGYEAELPAAYLDAFIEETTAGLFIGNRVPGPAETEVPLTSTIQFDLLSTVTGSAPSTGSINVYINGVAAVLAGVAQTGYSVSTTSVNTLTTRVVVTPSSSLASDATVTVRVQATAGALSLDETYSFTTVDLTAPALLSATAIGLRTVRLVFSEPMRHDSATLAASALNPANYTLTRMSFPSVSATVESVSTSFDTTFDLTTDIDLSPGATYQVSVVYVTDVHGNVVDVAYDEATFVAWEPPVPEGRSFDLYRMLPLINRQEDQTQDLFKFIACLQEVGDLLLYESDRFYDIIDPDTAPEYVLDLMLADLGNPFAFELSVTDKRRLIGVLVTMYSLKGTAPGIIAVVQFFLGITVTVDPYNTDVDTVVLGESEIGVDWQLGPGTSYGLYCFDVTSPQILTDTQRTQMLQIINYMKPAHTHLVSLNEPAVPPTYDHMELGVSELGVTWDLH
jgi:phage tail-like protein